MCKYNPTSGVEMDVIEKRVINRGYSIQNFRDTVKHYENMDILMVKHNRIIIVE